MHGGAPPCKAAPQGHTTRRPKDHARFCARRPSWPRVMSRCRRNDVGGGEQPVSSQASPRWKRARCDRWRVPCGSSPAPRLLVGASAHDEGRPPTPAWASGSVVGGPKTVTKGEFCIHSPSGLRMRIELAQTTISESPKHPDDDPGVCASSISCLILSLITLRIDPYMYVLCDLTFIVRGAVFGGLRPEAYYMQFATTTSGADHP